MTPSESLPSTPAPEEYVSSTRQSSFEVSDKGAFGEERCQEQGRGKTETRVVSSSQDWETHFLPLLVLTRWGAVPVKTSTGNNFLELP